MYILKYKMYNALHRNQIYLDLCQRTGLVEKTNIKVGNSVDSKSFFPVLTCLQASLSATNDIQ